MRTKLEVMLDDDQVPIQVSVTTYDDMGKRHAVATRSVEGMGLTTGHALAMALRMFDSGHVGRLWDAGDPS